MPRTRVIVHVGLPKTGTSFLQRVLWENRDSLATRGVHLPYTKRPEMFAAALHLTGKEYDWDRVGMGTGEAWTRICRTALRKTGTVVISSEWLCMATAEQAKNMLEQLGEAEVHVVVTVRDLARQLPAEWQEGVKHGRTLPFGQFLTSVMSDEGDHRELHARFWSAQDPLDVLRRWGPDLPADRVHVVTCPPPGAPRELLWQRFASILGVAADEVTLPTREINLSLGVTQVELLRRVNKTFRRRGQERMYRSVVKKYYAGQVLSSMPSPKATVPESWRVDVESVCARWIDELSQSGHRVVGDLNELLPQPAEGSVDTGHPAKPDEILDLSVRATVLLLHEVHRLRTANAELRRKKSPVWSQRLRSRLPQPVARRLGAGAPVED